MEMHHITVIIVSVQSALTWHVTVCKACLCAVAFEKSKRYIELVCREVCQVLNAWGALENLGNLLKDADMRAE